MQSPKVNFEYLTNPPEGGECPEWLKPVFSYLYRAAENRVAGFDKVCSFLMEARAGRRNALDFLNEYKHFSLSVQQILLPSCFEVMLLTQLVDLNMVSRFLNLLAHNDIYCSPKSFEAINTICTTFATPLQDFWNILGYKLNPEFNEKNVLQPVSNFTRAELSRIIIQNLNCDTYGNITLYGSSMGFSQFQKNPDYPLWVKLNEILVGGT